MTPSLRALLAAPQLYIVTPSLDSQRKGDFERSVRDTVRYEQGKQVSGMCERCVSQREMEEEHWRN